MEKEYPTPRSGSVEGSHYFRPANYMIFGEPGAYPIHVYESSSMSEKNFPPMLDTLVCTDCENMNSTLREEPPRTVTFCEDLGQPCNIDDSGWNLFITRETMESISMAYLSYPGVPIVKQVAWERTDVEQQPLRNTLCPESMLSTSH